MRVGDLNVSRKGSLDNAMHVGASDVDGKKNIGMFMDGNEFLVSAMHVGASPVGHGRKFFGLVRCSWAPT